MIDRPCRALVVFELEAWLNDMKLYNEKQYGKQRILDLRNRILADTVTIDSADGLEVVREPSLVWLPPEGCVIFYMYTETVECGHISSAAAHTWHAPTRGFFTFFKPTDRSDE